MTTLFDDQPVPTWALDCGYCQPDEFGRYSEATHQEWHLPVTCAVCGETSPSRWHANINHGVSLGASWQANALLCVSLSLRLNHLTYDKIHGREESHPMDLTALELGWRIGPSGEQIPPEGWPDGSHATKCVVMEAAA